MPNWISKREAWSEEEETGSVPPEALPVVSKDQVARLPLPFCRQSRLVTPLMEAVARADQPGSRFLSPIHY